MGSRKTHDGVEKVYAAAEAWVSRALRSDDSLFTPGKPIWTRELHGRVAAAILWMAPSLSFRWQRLL